MEPYRYLGVALPSVKLLLNQVKANRRDTRLIMHSLQASFQGDPHVSVCTTVIPDRVAYPNAASLGLPVHRVEPTPPSGSRGPCGAAVMRALAIELFPHWAERLVDSGTPVYHQPSVADRRLSRRG